MPAPAADALRFFKAPLNLASVRLMFCCVIARELASCLNASIVFVICVSTWFTIGYRCIDPFNEHSWLAL